MRRARLLFSFTVDHRSRAGMVTSARGRVSLKCALGVSLVIHLSPGLGEEPGSKPRAGNSSTSLKMCKIALA